MRNKVTFNDKLKIAKYYPGHSGPVTIELNQILGIGEFITSGGPLSDDYYLVLIAPELWFAIPMESHGMTGFVKWLEVEFKTEINTTLANTITEKSRMIYPEQLRVKEFIKCEQYNPKNWIDSLKIKFSIKSDKIIKLDSDISEILKPACNKM